MKSLSLCTYFFGVAFTMLASGCGSTELDRLEHIIVIYLENHSFDNLYGEFPGADGLAGAMNTTQVDAAGVPYPELPQNVAQSFPAGLPNGPFNIDAYLPLSTNSPDATHRFYHQKQQINGGRMDKFVLYNDDSAGFAMGYYHTAGLLLAEEAKKYTLCDRFFHAAFGGSFLNHQWLIAAATPKYPGTPPQNMLSILNPDGTFFYDGPLTPDGYVINTAFSVNAPRAFIADPERIPSLTNPTIGDRLSEAGVSWAWYAGGWSDAMAGTPSPYFQFHHQPFVYYASHADGTEAKARHLRDEAEFFYAAQNGKLPQVAYVKPLGISNEHPSYANILDGERHTIDLIDAVRSGPQWSSSVIIVTYDENGGFWDHVAPPQTDAWGPGARVPTIVISPYAKKGFVDHTQYDTTSILALIEHRFGLAPLSGRDAAAADLSAALDFPK
jgi:phospholipase C